MNALYFDVDKAFENFYDSQLLFCNLCFPIINVKIINKPIKCKWITEKNIQK